MSRKPKALDFVPMPTDAHEMDEILDFSERLNVGLASSLGHYQALWAYAGRQCLAGHLPIMSSSRLAKLCFWEGDADAFLDALFTARWLSPHDSGQGWWLEKWNEHAGKALGKRTLGAQRKAKYDAKKRAEGLLKTSQAKTGNALPLRHPSREDQVKDKEQVKEKDILGCAQVGYESSRAPAYHRVTPARCDLASAPDLPAKTGVPPDLPAAENHWPKSGKGQATPAPRQQAQTTALVVAPRVDHKNVMTRTSGTSESMSEPEIVVSDAVGLAFMHERVANDYKLGVPGTLFWKQDKTLEKAGRTLNKEEVDRAWQNAKAFSYNQNRPLKLNTFLRNLEFVMEDKQAEATMPSRRVANQVNSPSGDGMTWKQRKQLKEDQDFCKWAQSLEDAEEIQNSQAVSQ